MTLYIPNRKSGVVSQFVIFLSGIRATRIVTLLLIMTIVLKFPQSTYFYEFLHLSGNISFNSFSCIKLKICRQNWCQNPNFCSCNNLELRFITKSKWPYKITAFPLALLSALLLVSSSSMLFVGRAPEYSSLLSSGLLSQARGQLTEPPLKLYSLKSRVVIIYSVSLNKPNFQRTCYGCRIYLMKPLCDILNLFGSYFYPDKTSNIYFYLLYKNLIIYSKLNFSKL